MLPLQSKEDGGWFCFRERNLKLLLAFKLATVVTIKESSMLLFLVLSPFFKLTSKPTFLEREIERHTMRSREPAWSSIGQLEVGWRIELTRKLLLQLQSKLALEGIEKGRDMLLYVMLC